MRYQNIQLVGIKFFPKQRCPVYFKSLVKKYYVQIQSFQEIISEQKLDPDLIKKINLLSENVSTISPITQQFCLYQEVLFYRRHLSSDSQLICISIHRSDELIFSFYELFGHVGSKKCIAAMRDTCYFLNFSARIRRVVRNCDLCQRTKPSTTRQEGELQHGLANAPLDRVCVNLYGPLPLGWNHVRYLFVVLDCFTRFVRLYSIKRSTAIIVINRMTRDYIATYGVPKTVVSDHGMQFVSKIWQSRLSALGSNPTHTSVYHLQSNPAERVMRELERLFRIYCNENHTELPRYVPYIEWVLNNRVHESTGFTPSEMFIGGPRYNPFHLADIECPPDAQMDKNTKITMAKEIQLTKAEQRRIRHDRGRIPVRFKIGDQVPVRVHRLSSTVNQYIQKFFMLYEGSFNVIEIKCHNAYILLNPKTNRIRGTYNIIFLREYISPGDCKT